ncbi:unnamed protein product [Calypogeia fissa]
MEVQEQQAAAIRERDLALAMHETFLSSGSEDALSPRSPRFQNRDIRSPFGSFSNRSPRSSSTTRRPSFSSSSSPSSPSLAATVAAEKGSAGLESSKILKGDKQISQKLGQEDDGGHKLEQQGGGGKEETELKLEACLQRLRETEFDHHQKGVARLNNGSFGTCPKSVLLRQEQWMQQWLAQPDDMYFGPLDKGLLESRKVVAAHVNCPVEQLVLLDNVTVAANVVAMDVMWSFIQGHFQRRDCILLSNFTYGALKTTFEAYAVRAGAHILIADIPFPVSSKDEIVSSYERVLQGAQKDGRVIRLALVDHVVSMPSMIIPLKELISICRRYGVEQVLVDGAQTLGSVQLDLMEIDADYYAGNLHKWFFAPSSAAFLYSKAKHLPRLHHPIISHNYGKGFAVECEWMGTRDFSAMLAVPAAFDFFKKIPGGYEAVRAYNHKKIIAAGKMLAEAWGTGCGVAPDLCGSMVMVGLPPALGIQTMDDAHALRTRLRNEFSIEVHTFTPPRELAGASPVKGVTAHVRISHQIYNTWPEYLRLRDVINALVEEKSKK